MSSKFLSGIYAAVLLFGITTKPAEAEVLRYQCRTEGRNTTSVLIVDTIQQTLTYEGYGTTFSAKITNRYVEWADGDGDQHQIDRATGVTRFLQNGRWVILTPRDWCVALRGSNTTVAPESGGCRSLTGTWIYTGPWASGAVTIVIKPDRTIYFQSGSYLGAYNCENNSYYLQWQGNGQIEDLTLSPNGQRMTRTYALSGTHVFSRK